MATTTVVRTIEDTEEMLGTGSLDTLETPVGGYQNFWGTIVDAALQIVKYTPDPTEETPSPTEQFQRKLQLEVRADAGWSNTIQFNFPTDKATGEPEMVEKDGKFVAKVASSNSDWGKFAAKLASLGVPAFKNARELRGLRCRFMENTIAGYRGGRDRKIRLPMETSGYDNDFRFTIGLPSINISVTRDVEAHEKSLDDLVGNSWMEYKSAADKGKWSDQFTRGEVTKLVDSGVLVESNGKYERAAK